MSLQTRDLYCVDCEETVWGVACEYDRYPGCASCGGKMKISWEGGHAPSTDVYGSEQYSDATGMYHTSQRQKEQVMRDYGYEVAGDPVGGARKEHRLKGTTFSYGNQSSRRTVSEGA